MINPVSAYNVTNTTKTSKFKKDVTAAATLGVALGTIQTAADLGKTMKTTKTSLKELVEMCGGKLKLLTSSTLGKNIAMATAIGVSTMTAISLLINASKVKKVQ